MSGYMLREGTPPPAKAKAKPKAAPNTMAVLTGQASDLAGQDTNQIIGGLHSQQAALRAASAAQAAQINDAALATAKYLQSLGLGGKVASDYLAAAGADRAGAAGYSGGLQQTVGDAASQVQQHLASLGAPGQAENSSAAAGNVLYGLGGNLPAQGLDQVGPLVAAGVRALPAQTLAYGQQEATGAFGAGQAEAAKLNPDIVSALMNRPTLESKYLNEFVNAKTKAEQAQALADYRNAQLSKPIEYGSDATGRYLLNPQTGKVVQVTAPVAPPAASPVVRSFGNGGLARVNPDGTITTLRQPDPSASSTKPTMYQDSFGRQIEILPDGTQRAISPGQFTNPSTGVVYQVGTDGKLSPLTKPKAAKTKQNSDFPNLTKAQVKGLRTGIAGAFYGVPEVKDVNGKVTRAALPKLGYYEAITEAVKHGYSRAGATKMANRFYMPGDRGRPGGATHTWGNPTALISG